MLVNLVAYAIKENTGSEPGSGWAALRAHLENGHVVRVLTTTENKIIFDQSSLSNNKNVEILTIDFSRWTTSILKKMPFSAQLIYNLWAIKAGIKLRNVLKENGNIGIVHHSTYGGDWNLNSIIFLPRSQKSYWGPIGGCQKITFGEFMDLSLKGKAIEVIRVSVISLLRVLIRFAITNKNLTILSTNQSVDEFFGKTVVSTYCPNLILDFQDPHTPKEKKYIFSSGRLIPLKNYKLIVSAMQYMDSNIELVIAGDGFLRKSLIKQIDQLGLTDRIHLIGQVSHEKAIELLLHSSVFAFTSIRDSHSWSLAEAVHLGIPIATIGTPGNISVLKNAGPSYLPKRTPNPSEFAEYLKNPIILNHRLAFSLEKVSNHYAELFI